MPSLKALAAAALLSLAPTLAFSADAPALTTAWADMKLSQTDCQTRAERVMQNLSYKRIERIEASVFADSADGESQIVIRCASEKAIVFFVVAGGNGNLERVTTLLNSTRDAFVRN